VIQNANVWDRFIDGIRRAWRGEKAQAA